MHAVRARYAHTALPLRSVAVERASWRVHLRVGVPAVEASMLTSTISVSRRHWWQSPPLQCPRWVGGRRFRRT